jgi:hypothetical protein
LNSGWCLFAIFNHPLSRDSRQKFHLKLSLKSHPRGGLVFGVRHHFDTGGEFVNWHFIWYCQQKKITYTRAREGKKNDQAYVEQQNYSVVRRFVGYRRLDTWEQLKILNQLFEKLSDYQNFFQPVMRL